MSTTTNPGWVWFTLLSLVWSAAGCSRLRGPKTYAVRVGVAPAANMNSAIAVDLVAVRDKSLVDQLAKLPAAEWFEKREQFQRDFPAEGAIVVHSWEWIPGQSVPDVAVPRKPKPRAAFLFANYSTPGPHRARLNPRESIRLTLGDKDLSVEPLKSKKKK